jgi:uncharacterized protein YjaZ
MSIIPTNQWLKDAWEDPLKVMEKLTKYFENASADAIYQHLAGHGMYQLPFHDGSSVIQELIENKTWEIIKKQEAKLKKLWKGPEIPIFIFPADIENQQLKRHFNGKSGVAFQDKLFLFLSPTNSEREMKALLTHEYNHVCRIAQFNKRISDYNLLDTIILEGLAEQAVAEQVGNSYNAALTTYYSDYELERMWNRLIFPAHNLPKQHERHSKILYGLGLYPSMIGYAVGYYLVNQYLQENKLTSKELLTVPAKEIAKL